MPNGEKRIPMPWWWIWGEAEWQRDPRSRGMVKTAPGVWQTQQPTTATPGTTTPAWEVAAEGDAYYLDEGWSTAKPPYALGKGFHWEEVEFDPNTGTPIRGQLIPVADEEAEQGMGFGEPEPMTEYQQRSMELAEREAGRGREKTEAEIFEEARQKILTETTGARDWIKHWMAGHTPTSYQAPSRRILTMEEAQEGISPYDVVISPTIEAARDVGATSWIPTSTWEEAGGQEAATARTQELEAMVAQGYKTDPFNLTAQGERYGVLGASGALSRQVGSVTGLGEGATRPTTPPAPAWLPKFAPSQVAGQPITRGAVTTPSPQQWTRTPWSVRKGLEGYMEFAGQRPFVEMTEQMEMMMPTAPTATGAKRWRPIQKR